MLPRCEAPVLWKKEFVRLTSHLVRAINVLKNSSYSVENSSVIFAHCFKTRGISSQACPLSRRRALCFCQGKLLNIFTEM